MQRFVRRRQGPINTCALQLPVHPSIGAKATLVIQPEFGYGDGGAGADIPGGATLNFGEKEYLFL